MTNAPTISSVLDEFRQAQQERLAPRTFATYAAVIGLLRSFLDNYGYQSLSETEHQRWQAAYDAGDEEAFCRLFGPQQILDGMGEFLGCFMVRKVIAGQELLRGAGIVTKKLAGWMAEQGYVNPGPVPESAAKLAQPGWSITLTLARSAGRWHIVEVGNVYP